MEDYVSTISQKNAARERRKEDAKAALDAAGIKYIEKTGPNLVIRVPAGIVYFSPSTEHFHGVVSGDGVYTLIKRLKELTEELKEAEECLTKSRRSKK